jgi:hypothetical protein
MDIVKIMKIAHLAKLIVEVVRLLLFAETEYAILESVNLAALEIVLFPNVKMENVK